MTEKSDRKEYMREYKQNMSEEQKERARQKSREYMREYRQNMSEEEKQRTKEKQKEYMREYRQNMSDSQKDRRKEYMREYMREYRQLHRQTINHQARTRRYKNGGKGGINYIKYVLEEMTKK